MLVSVILGFVGCTLFKTGVTVCLPKHSVCWQTGFRNVFLSILIHPPLSTRLVLSVHHWVINWYQSILQVLCAISLTAWGKDPSLMMKREGPKFNRENSSIWKDRMKIYIRSMGAQHWSYVENAFVIPTGTMRPYPDSVWHFQLFAYWDYYGCFILCFMDLELIWFHDLDHTDICWCFISCMMIMNAFL